MQSSQSQLGRSLCRHISAQIVQVTESERATGESAGSKQKTNCIAADEYRLSRKEIA